jgi:hypothetical protein
MFGILPTLLRGLCCNRIAIMESTEEATPDPTPRPLPKFAVELLNCMAFTADSQPAAGYQVCYIGEVHGSISARLQSRT